MNNASLGYQELFSGIGKHDTFAGKHVCWCDLIKNLEMETKSCIIYVIPKCNHQVFVHYYPREGRTFSEGPMFWIAFLH